MKIGFSIKSLDEFNAHIKPFLLNNIFNKNQIIIFHIDPIFSSSSKVPNDVEFIDLTKYLFLKSVLNKINLSAIIFFSPGQLFDIFFVQLCNELKIDTIYFQHGISLDFSKFNPKIIDRNRSIKRIFKSGIKFSFIYVYIFLNLLFLKKKYKLIWSIIIRSVQIFITNQNPKNSKYGLKDNHCRFGFVYGKNDKKYLININNYVPENVFINSYPFLKINSEEIQNKNNKRTILYISSGLLISGVIKSTQKKEKKFYVKLANDILYQGYNLVIKIHPLEDINIFKEYLIDFPEVVIYDDKNLANLTENSVLVIGDYSTALFYAVKYLKPIILLQSNQFDKYPFDFTDYKIGKKCYLNDLKVILRDKDTFHVDNFIYVDFQKNYLGGKEINAYENFNKIFNQKILLENNQNNN